MAKKFRFLMLIFQAVFLVSFSVAGWAGKENAPSQDVVVSGDATEVIWIIHAGNRYQRAELRVSPPEGGEVSIQVFDSSETPYYNPAGDGFYDYELTLLPAVSQALSEELGAARAAAGGQEARSAVAALKAQGALPESEVYTGGFRIFNGELVVGDIKE
ncbi:MAG: hypothetical protein ACU826_00225 [Gammaproteobacteria bacterium]